MLRNKFLVNFAMGFVKLTGLWAAFLFLKPRVKLEPEAARRLPKPVILVSNHMSLMDFVLYLVVFPFRTIRFLMAEVLYNKNKPFAFFLNAIGGIRVDRDSKDFGFVSDALEVLDDGGSIGVFPQGRLPRGESRVPFTASTAFIALHTDAPIVPVYTDGSYGLFKRAGVVIGKPIYLADYCGEDASEAEKLEQMTKLLEEKVYSLAQYLEEPKK